MRSFAQYTLLECIGRGGLAEVWRVVDATGHHFALKILAVDAAGPDSARLRHEFSLMAPLRHPHVVQVFEIVEDAGRVGLVLELCVGSLADVVKRRGPLPPRSVCAVGRQVAGGLAAAHRAGIVHRDVKPANVLVASDDTVKLTDFGIASLLDEPGARTEQSALWGTLPFLAPERRHGGRGTPEADIYGLASTLAWLATGRMVGDLYVRPVQQSLRVDLPSRLVDVLERAGRYDPEDRYRSADELATALEEVEQTIPSIPYALADASSRSALDTRGPASTAPTAAPPPRTLPIGPTRVWSWPVFAFGGVMLATGALLMAWLGSRIFDDAMGPLIAAVASARQTSMQAAMPTSVAAWTSGETPAALELEDVPACKDSADYYRKIVRVGPKESVGVLAEDLDGDGWVDLVFTNQLDESLSFYWGGDDRILEDPVRYPILRSNTGATSADLDGDGDLDLVVNHLDASMVSFHLNEGNRRFVEQGRLAQAPPPAATRAVDWNGDGHVDLLMSLRGNGDCIGLRLGSEVPLEFGGYVCIGSYAELTTSFDPTTRSIARITDRHVVVRHGRGVADGIGPGDPVLPEHTAFYPIAQPVFAETHPTPGQELYVYVTNGRDSALLRVDSEGRLCRQGAAHGLSFDFGTTIADVDRDGSVDTIWIKTCSYCESNHGVDLGVDE